METPPIRVIVADDHQIFIEGLKAVLGHADVISCEVVGEARTGASLLHLLEKTQTDLLLLDMNLPDMDGIEILTSLRARGDQFRVIILSMFEETKIVKAAFKAGVDGYVLKSNNVKELFQAIRIVMTGETYISKGLSLTNGISSHVLFASNGRLSVSYDDRFIKKFNLTKRELEVLKLIGQAMSNKEIAKELYISDQTVSVHRKNIMRKLGVSSSASLIKLAFENNLM